MEIKAQEKPIISEALAREPILYQVQVPEFASEKTKKELDLLNRNLVNFPIFDAFYIKRQNLFKDESKSVVLPEKEFEEVLDEKNSLFKLRVKQESLKELQRVLGLSDTSKNFSEESLASMADLFKKIGEYYAVHVWNGGEKLIVMRQKLENGNIKIGFVDELVRDTQTAMDEYIDGLLEKLNPKTIKLSMKEEDLNEAFEQVKGLKHDYLDGGFAITSGYLDITDMTRPKQEDVKFLDIDAKAIRKGMNILGKAIPAVHEELTDLYPKEIFTFDSLHQQIKAQLNQDFLKFEDDEFDAEEFKNLEVVWAKRFIPRLIGNIIQNADRLYRARDELVEKGELEKPSDSRRLITLKFEKREIKGKNFLAIIFRDQATGILSKEIEEKGFNGTHTYADTSVSEESTGVGMKEQKRIIGKYGGVLDIKNREDGIRGADIIAMLPIQG